GKPEKMLAKALDADSYVTVDQVARLLVNEDSTFQLIDLRSPEEFNNASIPQAINIPYNKMLSTHLETYLNRDVSNIFYANGDYVANYALVLADGLGFRDNKVMKGGLNEWYEVIMNTRFTGNKISARENVLYEIRTKAGRQFKEFNSMPDSLKARYRESKEIQRKKLDGGCE
ncbi:MAG: rhodanese-like domain-containing protein, partial [Bacteroidales bacterium]|nr:rhodanese-like domain-containing protein [Bacteroidales bacterium]